MTEEKSTAMTKPGRMKITQFIERRSSATGPAQTRGQVGGHHFFCSHCGGFRTHRVTLGTDKKLTLECSGCQKRSVLVRHGGVWVPEHLGETLRAYIPVRAEQVILEYLAKREAPTPVPEPGAVERAKGSVAKLFPALEHLTHREIDEVLEQLEEQPETAERESGGVLPGGKRPGTGSNADSRMTLQNAGPDATRPVASGMSKKTKAKAAVVAVSAPFLLMGALYALAWRGFYVWPIYYAIQPYYQSWMNDWWFASLSLIVPAVAVGIYAVRFRSGKDIIDWQPEE